jgi:choloylglycine hydrolase
MAGLNFPDNACYFDYKSKYVNITPYEFIPFVLGQAESVYDAKKLISQINLVKIPFSKNLPLAPLHWIISDKEESITVESVKDGVKIYENKVGVLTNNPPFDVHMFNLDNYYNLNNKAPSFHFVKDLDFKIYCNGLGALGLPGDFSSMSRFVRAVFMKEFSKCEENENISQFFHILGSVSQIKGATIMKNGDYDITLYTSCCDMEEGIYYYKTYNNSQISAVKLGDNLDGEKILKFDLVTDQQINMVNLAN